VIRHAGLIAQRVDGRWLGVLIEGASGTGKSDLALRALGQGFRLVADDRVLLWATGGRLFGRAPDTLHGLIEVCGLDVVAVEALPFCEVGLVAHIGQPERLPDPAFDDILGVSVASLTTSAFEASTPAKLSRALSSFDAAHKRRI
jgi:serine kinase of HPr protein (carbohydrate metabolism regulator)